LKLTRVGIVGAGQLGRMLALAGYPLGIRCVFLDRGADAPAAQVELRAPGERMRIGPFSLIRLADAEDGRMRPPRSTGQVA